MESILTSVKKMLGIEESYKHFDTDIIMHINSVFLTLNQLGVGPEESFAIENADATWSDFLGEQLAKLQAVKSYMYLKVKMLFDPPTSSFVLDSYGRQVNELEWRLNVQVENAAKEGENQNGT